MTIVTFTDSKETVDEYLSRLHHIASDGARIQQYFGQGGSILQVCCLCCDEDALQHGRSCEVVFQAHSEVLGSSSKHCVGMQGSRVSFGQHCSSLWGQIY
jgi:hypothetical protein